jgi:hypothetical protein
MEILWYGTEVALSVLEECVQGIEVLQGLVLYGLEDGVLPEDHDVNERGLDGRVIEDDAALLRSCVLCLDLTLKELKVLDLRL